MLRASIVRALSLGLCGAMLAAPAALAQAPVQLATADGKSTVNLGLLAQGSLNVDRAAGQASASDMMLRRIRFIAGGKIASRIKFFVESDTPYVGRRGNADWSVPPTFIQDLIVTLELRDEFQIDAGLLLVPVSYNSTQSAASLLAVGYGPYSFLASTPTKSRVGRDQGVQARGYLFHKTIEYRAGAFRGASRMDDVPLRYAARAAWYPFGAQTGFFYAGTLHGHKKMLVVGTSIDAEGQYRAHSADVFAEWPLPNHDALTLQADYVRYDGGTTFLQLPRQNTWLVEGGYRFGASQVGAYGQVARQDISAASAADGAMAQGGVIYWAKDNRLNVKAGIGRTTKDGAASHMQLLGQIQLFVF